MDESRVEREVVVVVVGGRERERWWRPPRRVKGPSAPPVVSAPSEVLGVTLIFKCPMLQWFCLFFFYTHREEKWNERTEWGEGTESCDWKTFKLWKKKRKKKRLYFTNFLRYFVFFFFCLILDRDGLSKVNPWLNSRVLSPLDGQAKK